jgi:hypothetical protein
MIYFNSMLDSNSLEGRFFERFFGSYNSLPPNIKELSLDEFSACGITNSMPSHVEYRQRYCCGQEALDINRYDPMNLYYINMIRGYATLNSYGKNIRFFLFDCVNLIKKAYDELPITEDSCWKKDEATSNSRRGITNFSKNVTVSRPLTADENLVFSQFNNINSPGNGVVSILKSYTQYHLKTCYDCSD